MDDLKIPKNRVKATAYFSDKTKIRGEVFLSSYAFAHEGHQHVGDLLESDKVFIPFLVNDTDQSELVNKEKIMILEGEFTDDSESMGEEERIAMGLLSTYHVRVIFHGGERIEGILLAEVQPDASRLSDCLNLPSRFLRFRKGSRFLHLNRDMITRVISLDDA